MSHINEQFTSNTTLSVLAEAESLASYGRKRLALSYEKPTTSQRVKSHSPNEGNMSWDVTCAMEELENYPNQKAIGLKWHVATKYLTEMAARY